MTCLNRKNLNYRIQKIVFLYCDLPQPIDHLDSLKKYNDIVKET